MDDRIKLAEAMGWKWEQHPESWHYSHVYPEMGVWFRPDGSAVADLDCGCKVPPPFDPFTDANDDYACLQFAREQGNPLWTPFMHHCEQESHQYKIGDWARALLVAIEVTSNG